MRLLSVSVVTLALVGAAPLAWGQATGTAGARGIWPTQVISRPATLDRNQSEVWAPVGVFLNKDNEGEPIFAAPNLGWGIHDNLTLRLMHLEPVRPPSVPGGLCLSGSDNGCPEVYLNTTVDLMWGISARPSPAAIHVGIDAYRWDPFFLGATGGVLLRLPFASDKLALQLDPSVYIAITKRDEGNEDRLGVPAQLTWQATPEIAVYGLSGLYSTFDDFGDLYEIPLGAGFTYNYKNVADVGAQFVFTNLLGANDSADGRLLMVYAGFRM